MMLIPRPQSRRIRMNLTPLIDIIFLLVVFFMLTSKFSIEQLVPLHLSTIASGDGGGGKKALLLTMHSDDIFLMHQEPYPLEMIFDAIKLQETEQVIIKTKSQVTVQGMMQAIEAFERENITQLSFLKEE